MKLMPFLPEAKPTGLLEVLAQLEECRRRRRWIKPGKIYVLWAPEAFGSRGYLETDVKFQI